MQASELAQFFRAIGNRIIQTESCYWYNPKPFLFKSLPIHRFVDPSPSELAQVMIKGPAFAIRYPKTPDQPGPRGGMYICSNRDYDFPALSQNVRSRTRRGLARCRIEQIDFDYLAQHGHALTTETTFRQMGTAPSATEEEWKLFCTNASRSKDFEAWGAFVEDRLATFIVAMLVEDCYYIHLQKSASDLLKYYPNNALLFTVMKTKLACPEVGYISHGPKALAVGKGLDYFKTSMGFELQPYTDHVVFNPLVKPFLMWKGDAVVDRLVQRYPDNLFWQRAARALRVARGEDPREEPSKGAQVVPL
jgi:hypothetical protein